MTTEEAREELTNIINLRKEKCSKRNIKFDTCIVSTKAIETVLQELEEKEDDLYAANNIISDYIDITGEMRENIKTLAKEMDKDGSMYWAKRLRELL